MNNKCVGCGIICGYLYMKPLLSIPTVSNNKVNMQFLSQSLTICWCLERLATQPTHVVRKKIRSVVSLKKIIAAAAYSIDDLIQPYNQDRCLTIYIYSSLSSKVWFDRAVCCEKMTVKSLFTQVLFVSLMFMLFPAHPTLKRSPLIVLSIPPWRLIHYL